MIDGNYSAQSLSLPAGAPGDGHLEVSLMLFPVSLLVDSCVIDRNEQNGKNSTVGGREGYPPSPVSLLVGSWSIDDTVDEHAHHRRPAPLP